MLEQFEDAKVDAAPAPRRRTRLRRTVGVVFVLVALLVVGTVAGYFVLLNRTVAENVRHEALLPTPGADGVEEAPVKKAGTEKAQNFLVIGSDGRAGLAGERSDVIILMHVAADRRSVSLVHFPRDLYVDIPGRGKDKINAAYAYGGAPLLVRTVQGLVQVPVDHVAVIGFEGFRRLTDAVGGVTVYVEEPSTSGGYTFAKGFQKMGGDEALAFVRERKQLSEGDISRGRRQQAFIKALLLTSLSRDTLKQPLRLAHVIDAGTANLTVDEDFSVGEMRSMAFAMRGLRGKDISFVTAPFTGYGTAPNGGSIDLLDEAGMAELGRALQEDDMDSYADRTTTP